jgi:MFS transporter, OFA family, oxalate/formate antiporter
MTGSALKQVSQARQSGDDVNTNTKPLQPGSSLLANPWGQLIIGVICMACVANMQYGWTLFVNPIDAKYHWGRPAIQVAFTCVGNALKWFPGRRGLAAGITASGFGAGAAITIGPISKMINSSGYEQAFFTFGLLQGAIVFVMAWGLFVAPASLAVAKTKVSQTAHGYTPTQVLRSPCFWVMYLMFVLIAAGGLTMAASMAPIAKDFGIEKTPVGLFGVVMPALVFALALNRIFDGVGRPFFGWVSDQIGREYTMAIAFLIGAAALFALSRAGNNPVLFVLVTAVYFGVYGEIFSLFPATQGDTFGARYAAANAGMLYTAKGAGSLLVPIATAIAKAEGWSTVFSIALAFNVIAAILALVVLKPMRQRHFAAIRTADPVEPAATTGTGVSRTRLT